MAHPIDVEHRLKCTYPGCWINPLPGRRNCNLHADVEPVTRQVTECEAPSDIEGVHDHNQCLAKQAQRGHPHGTCAHPTCWRAAGGTGRCEYHDTTHEFGGRRDPRRDRP